MAVNPPIILPSGFICSRQQVLNSWEQTLYNLCEEYFYLRQRKSNRHPVLGQVRLTDAVKVNLPIIKSVQVPETIVEHIKVPAFKIDIYVNAMSFDILITDGQGNPKVIFEADGKYHDKPEGLSCLDAAKAYAKVKDWATQVTRDNYKDAIAKQAGISLFRVKVDGIQTHIDVVHAEADIKEFQRDLEYSQFEYSVGNFPDQSRVLEAADIELLLIRAEWSFPAGWDFVTHYELR